MATIFNTVERVAGEDEPRFVIRIDLLWDSSLAPVAKVEDADIMISGPFYTMSDADGFWKVDHVYPNDVIVPTGSVYRVTETFSSSEQKYFIQIPSGATEFYWTGDYVVPSPVWVR